MEKKNKIMEWWGRVYGSEKAKQIKKIIKDTGYGKVVLLLIAGALLIVLSIPGNSGGDKNTGTEKKKELGTTSTEQISKFSEQVYARELEEELKELLRQVDGVGQVEVMITLKSSAETVVNKDVSQSESSSVRGAEEGEQNQEAQNQSEEETVLVEDSEGNQSPYIIKEIQPEIAGIVVICDGGSDPLVISNITSAAEVLFSVSAHKVKVMKKI